MPSLRLRTEPSLRQTVVILARVERELGERGARVSRGARGELRFRMPPPWAAQRASFLLLVPRGHVRVSAGGGGPRRLRFELRYFWFYVAGVLATAALLALGWGWPRVVLVNALIALWGVVALLILGARRRFRLLLARCAREIIDRRTTPRDGPAVSSDGVTSDGAASDGADTTGHTDR